MNVISRPAIRNATAKHPDAAEWLDSWWYVAKAARWESLHDVHAIYASADQVGQCLVFNVHGNKYRFVVRVKYADTLQRGTIWIKDFLTHAEYSKERWKGNC